MTIQCCVCKKVKDEDSWTKKQIAHPQDVSHTYCPLCLKRSRAAIDTELKTCPATVA